MEQADDRSPVLIQRQGSPTRREWVDLGHGNAVQIRIHQTIEDRAIIQQATVTGQITAKAGGDTVNMGQLALGAAPLQTLIQMVTGWRGPAFCRIDHSDENGYLKVPDGHTCEDFLEITPANLKGLLNGPGQQVLDVIEAHNPQAVKKGNPTNGGGSNT
jgi:hypothetical protein